MVKLRITRPSGVNRRQDILNRYYGLTPIDPSVKQIQHALGEEGPSKDELKKTWKKLDDIITERFVRTTIAVGPQNSGKTTVICQDLNYLIVELLKHTNKRWGKNFAVHIASVNLKDQIKQKKDLCPVIANVINRNVNADLTFYKTLSEDTMNMILDHVNDNEGQPNIVLLDDAGASGMFRNSSGSSPLVEMVTQCRHKNLVIFVTTHRMNMIAPNIRNFMFKVIMFKPTELSEKTEAGKSFFSFEDPKLFDQFWRLAFARNKVVLENGEPGYPYIMRIPESHKLTSTFHYYYFNVADGLKLFEPLEEKANDDGAFLSSDSESD